MEINISWGILSTADIAVESVIPAMLNSEYCLVKGIASRDIEKARNIADRFQIPKYFGSYQELLDDKEIEAVYIPLPNHLHVEWAVKALQAGKHVLLEKPVALSSAEALELLKESKNHPDLKIMEGFMYKFHPQWVRVKEIIDRGEVGELKLIQSSFSFFDNNPESIVNNEEYGGGSLMDIGCYPISISRYLFNSEPLNVYATIKYNPELKVDVLASAVMEFDQGTSLFFSSIQMFDDQQVYILGTKGSITFELPFNPPADQAVKIWLVKENVKKEIEFEQCDQYASETDIFSLAILEHKDVPVGLEDAVKNMIVIEKLRESNKLGRQLSL